MLVPRLLGRVLLRFQEGAGALTEQLSAATTTPDGSLWVGADEGATIERLSPTEPFVFGDQASFAVADFIDLPEPQGEIDIEGLDYADGYLWFTGSHSQRRQKPKGKKRQRDLQRLAAVDPQPNRYVLGRVPVLNGQLFASCSRPGDRPGDPALSLTAGTLRTAQHGNVLLQALQDDEHLGRILSFDLPSKENGFDVEGLAVRGDRILLGLRGPVLGGWAIILDFEVATQTAGALALRPGTGSARPYRKHFLDLDGLGVRELSFAGDDLLILAGPTLALEGAMKVFRLRDVVARDADSISDQDSKDLEMLFDLPFTVGADHAEGMTPFPAFGEDAVLIVYDSPAAARYLGRDAVFADLFALR